jgi:hypothetical protein
VVKKNRVLKFALISIILITAYILMAQAARLPIVNSDLDTWGTILNNFLTAQHTNNGTHKNVTVDGYLNVTGVIRSKKKVLAQEICDEAGANCKDIRAARWSRLTGDGTVSSSVKIANSTGGGPNLSGGDSFGRQITRIGDFNGDGVEDLAVGADSDDTGGTNRGAVYILFMNSNGTVSSSVKIASDTNGGPALVDNDFFGRAVSSIGDLNNDNVVDLAVGLIGDDTGGAARGAVYILFMNSNGTVSSSVKIASDTNGGPTLSDSDQFGNIVYGLDDLDGDNVRDLAVGAWQDDTGGTARGAFYILFMNSNGTASSSVKIASDTNGGPALVNSDLFASSLSEIGDLNGDGVHDLAVGAIGDAGGGEWRGSVYVLFMNSNGTVNSYSKIASGIGGAPTFIDRDYFGGSVSQIGDLNGDGIKDLAVGAYGDDTGGTDRGALYVLFMNIDGTVNSYSKIASDTNGGPTLANNDAAGIGSLSIGDLNGDGVQDLILGTPADATAGAWSGAIYVLFMAKNNVFYASGNVGIGLPYPGMELVVSGRANISQNLTVNNSVLFVDGTSGRVGIGNSAPKNLLDVSGNVNVTGILYAGSSNITNTIEAFEFVGDGSKLTGVTAAFSNESDINVTNFVANKTLFVDGSRVGIGTASETAALEVAGNITSRGGNFTVGSATEQTNITMFSPNGALWRCGIDNSGSFTCS